jgi:hypothetical protein
MCDSAYQATWEKNQKKHRSSISLILVHRTKYQQYSQFISWVLGFQTIEYFELIWLVKGPPIAIFNQYDLSHFSIGLSPSILSKYKYKKYDLDYNKAI